MEQYIYNALCLFLFCVRITNQHKLHSLSHLLGSLPPPSMTLPKSHFNLSNCSQLLTAGMKIILFQLDAAEKH